MSKRLRFAAILKIRTILSSMVDTNAMILMILASIIILGTKPCQWLGINAGKLNFVLEYFGGKMEATTIITYGERMMYTLITADFSILITMLPNVLVKYPLMCCIAKLIKDSFAIIKINVNFQCIIQQLICFI